MRIWSFADIRFPIERANGIQTMETCAALAARGHDVRLVVRPDVRPVPRDPFEYYGVAPRPGLVIRRLRVAGPPRLRRAGYLAQAIGLASRAGAGSVILTRDLGFASLCLRLRGLVRAPLVYESHGFAPAVSRERPAMLSGAEAPSAMKLRRLEARERLTWARAAGYVTITAALRDELVERLGPRPHLAVVPDGVRLRAHLPAGDWAMSATPVVAYAGHLYPWKGVEILLDALAAIPGVRGLIVGGHPLEGDLARLKSRAEALGISGRTEFTGMVDPPQVAAHLGRADILVLPNPATTVSARYTSPLKLFEYLAAGRPIVAADLPSFREVLSDGANARFFQPGDADDLARRIREILGDSELAVRLARAAAETAAGFSWDRRAERLEALLGDVVGA